MANSITFDEQALSTSLTSLSESYKLVADKIKELETVNDDLSKNWKCVEGRRVIKNFDTIKNDYIKMENAYNMYYRYLSEMIAKIYNNVGQEINSAISSALKKGSEN